MIKNLLSTQHQAQMLEKGRQALIRNIFTEPTSNTPENQENINTDELFGQVATLGMVTENLSILDPMWQHRRAFIK